VPQIPAGAQIAFHDYGPKLLLAKEEVASTGLGPETRYIPVKEMRGQPGAQLVVTNEWLDENKVLEAAFDPTRQMRELAKQQRREFKELIPLHPNTGTEQQHRPPV
jgi:hypothetical protein